jgi:hypothetical protein
MKSPSLDLPRPTKQVASSSVTSPARVVARSPLRRAAEKRLLPWECGQATLVRSCCERPPRYAAPFEMPQRRSRFPFRGEPFRFSIRPKAALRCVTFRRVNTSCRSKPMTASPWRRSRSSQVKAEASSLPSSWARVMTLTRRSMT